MPEENTEITTQGLTADDAAGAEIENEKEAGKEASIDDASTDDAGKENDAADNAENQNEFIGMPENGYTSDNIKLPENMKMNEEVLGEFNEFAKKVNMSQKAYEESVNYGVKLVQDTQNKMIEAFKQQNEQRISGYQRESFNDKEIGGDKYDESLSTAIIGYKYYVKNVDAELDKYMQESGLQYNKSFIKLFKYIGSQMQDDKMGTDKTYLGEKKNSAEDIAARMFPTMSDKN